jgi:putative tryptophan/tyrosine transport system substrate-binding protein
MGPVMRRREFISLIGSAATMLPVTVSSQTPPKLTIGYLSSRSSKNSEDIIAAFRKGLSEAGFIEGHNVTIVSRFAEGRFDRLPALTADLVALNVNVVVATGGTVSVVKAKQVVPKTVPMVFAMGGDPVKLGVVASLNRPGENITGVAFLVNGLAGKQMELLHSLVPTADVIGFLVNAKDPNAETDSEDAQAAASLLGLKLVVCAASNESEIEVCLASLAQQHVGVLFVDAEPFLLDHRNEIIALAARTNLPIVSQFRLFADGGGLAAYGTSLTDANRLLGVYTGRVLKGEKPADLPVLQSTKFDLVINLKTAKSFGVNVPPSLIATADEVIE